MNTTYQSIATTSRSPGRERRGGRAWLGWAVLAGSLLFKATLLDGADQASSRGTAPQLPTFVFEPLFASNQGTVHGIYEAAHADLVLFEGGYDSGFRTGMVCRVVNREQTIGEVLVVDVRNNCAAAVIMDLEAGQVIESGNSISVKTVKF